MNLTLANQVLEGAVTAVNMQMCAQFSQKQRFSQRITAPKVLMIVAPLPRVFL